MSDLLSKKYVIPVLAKLSLEGNVKMTDFIGVVSNYATIQLLIRDLEEQGYVTTTETFEDKRKIYVSLTVKGKQVAEQLRKAQLVSEGKELPETPEAIKMPPDWKDRFKGLSAMTHLNVLDDHVAIQEIDNSGKTTNVVMVYIKRINSHFELWCEKDESKECKHVDFAWSLPQMRGLIEDYIREGKIKERGLI